MKLKKEDWEAIKKQAESMIKDNQIGLMAAEMMFNRACIELNDIAKEEEGDGK